MFKFLKSNPFGKPREKPTRRPKPDSRSYQAPRESVIAPVSGRKSKVYAPGQSTVITGRIPNFADPIFLRQMVPTIRNLAYKNPDVSQALKNIVQLANTGYTLEFDDGVTAEQAKRMRRHLNLRMREWEKEHHTTTSGLVNKMFSQLYIGGAISNEWQVNNELDGIKAVRQVNPEDISFRYERGSWQPYQILEQDYLVNLQNLENFSYNKLNRETFRYYAINGDTEVPNGIPPWLPVIGPIHRQKTMFENVDFIIDQMGVMGFLEILIDPEAAGLNPAFYRDRPEEYKKKLKAIIQEARDNLQGGMKDGLVAGVKDQHDFEFHSATNSAEGAEKLIQENELQTFTALDVDASILGRGYSSSETQATVLFTKLVSQLTNAQEIVAANLEFGYGLELTLAGFSFTSLKVVFKASTALDKLKEEQAEEIRLRNSTVMYNQGIISQQKYAERHNVDIPDQEEPRMTAVDVQADELARQQRESDKDTSDRNQTERDNQPTNRSN